MADPKVTLQWTESNADETGQQVFITTEPWNRGEPVTKIKDVAPDLTSTDLTLDEITIEPGFLQVAAVRGGRTVVVVRAGRRTLLNRVFFGGFNRAARQQSEVVIERVRF